MAGSTGFSPMPRLFSKLQTGEAWRPLSGFGKHWLDYLVVIFGCIAYVAAVNLTSRGSVKIDQFEYWLLGLGAQILVVALMRIRRRFSMGTGSVLFNEGFFASAWLLSLLNFVALRVTLQSESYEFPLYASLNYNYFIARIVLSFFYSACGYATALAIFHVAQSFRSWRRTDVIDILLGLLITAALFFILVNPAPH